MGRPWAVATHRQHCCVFMFLSEIRTKLHDWAVGQAGGSCYSQAALSSNDSKTLYVVAAIESELERVGECPK